MKIASPIKMITPSTMLASPRISNSEGQRTHSSPVSSISYLWPGRLKALQPTGGTPEQKSFDHPKSTVHVTTGNGGPPSKDTMDTPMAALREGSAKYGYGRVRALNASHLVFEQVLNGYSDEGREGEIMDTWTIVQPSHGPFA